jgi:Lipase (class 3)
MTRTSGQHLDLTVHGGIGGITAQLEDMEAAAKLVDNVSLELLGLAASCHGFLASADLVASAMLDPGGAARFEAALLAVLDGPHGLTATAGGIGLRAVQMRAAVMAYRATDNMAADLMQTRRFLQGALALPAGLLAGARWFAGEQLLDGGEAAADLQRLLTDHPGIVDEVVGSAPGFVSTMPSVFGAPLDGLFRFVTGKTLLPTTVAQGAGLLALLYPDGRQHVEPLGLDEGSTSMTKPPRNFDDIMSGLDYRNSQAQGQIDVRIVERTMADGSVRRSYIADIPGTKDWQLNPAGHRKHLNDLGTNLHALAGDVTSYERGVREALRRAGAKPGDPVMLVGHSQGGMVAVRAANDLVTSGTFNVTHVVTAGSPVAGMTMPRSVKVLSLENKHDIVPHLDGRDNPDAANWITVTFDRQFGSVGDNHSITGIKSPYRGAAKELDRSNDPSVKAYRDSADTFFHGDRVKPRLSGHSRHVVIRREQDASAQWGCGYDSGAHHGPSGLLGVWWLATQS